MMATSTYFRAFLAEVIQKESLLSAWTAHVQGYHERVQRRQQPSVDLISRLGQLFLYLRQLIDGGDDDVDEAILLIHHIITIEVSHSFIHHNRASCYLLTVYHSA